MSVPFFGKPLETLPVLEARQQVRLQRRVREYKQPSQHLRPGISQPAHITPQRPLLSAVLDVALDRQAIVVYLPAGAEVAAAQEGLQTHILFQLDSAQKMVRLGVVENQVVVIVKQDDALIDVFKHAGFQAVQQSMGGVAKAAPVQQEGRQAVAADGIVQKIVDVYPRQVQEHRIHSHNRRDSGNHVEKLSPVFPRDPAHLQDEQHQHHRHQRISKKQVQPVQGLHLVGVSGNHRIPRHIAQRDFGEGIENKNRDLKGSVQSCQPDSRPGNLRKLVFREKHRKNEQTDQHEIDADKMDAGHHRHTEIVVVQNADQITDVHHRRACAGQPQIPTGGLVLLHGFDGQNGIRYRNRDRDKNVAVQKCLIHTA